MTELFTDVSVIALVLSVMTYLILIGYALFDYCTGADDI